MCVTKMSSQVRQRYFVKYVLNLVMLPVGMDNVTIALVLIIFSGLLDSSNISENNVVTLDNSSQMNALYKNISCANNDLEEVENVDSDLVSCKYYSYEDIKNGTVSQK